MKNILLFIFLIISQLGNSQILISIIFGDKLNSPNMEFGLEGGWAGTSINGLESQSYAHNLNLGFYFDIRLKQELWLKTGVMVKSSSGSGDLSAIDVKTLYPEISTIADSGSYSQALGQFNVPILIKYRFQNHLYCVFGPQISLLTKAKLNYEHSYENIILNTSINNTNSFNRFDIGLSAGFGYTFKMWQGMNVGVRYYLGLTDITRGNSKKHTSSGFLVKLDIPIGKDKD